jgi:hypothetical protein
VLSSQHLWCSSSVPISLTCSGLPAGHRSWEHGKTICRLPVGPICLLPGSTDLDLRQNGPAGTRDGSISLDGHLKKISAISTCACLNSCCLTLRAGKAAAGPLANASPQVDLLQNGCISVLKHHCSGSFANYEHAGPECASAPGLEAARDIHFPFLACRVGSSACSAVFEVARLFTAF